MQEPSGRLQRYPPERTYFSRLSDLSGSSSPQGTFISSLADSVGRL